MIAIFIDSRNKKFEQIEVNSLEDMQSAVGGDIERASDFFTGDTVYVNEDGMARFDHFFICTEGSNENPLAGCGVVVGPADAEGNPTDCLYTLADIEKRVVFMNRPEVVSWINDRRAYDRANGYARFI